MSIMDPAIKHALHHVWLNLLFLSDQYQGLYENGRVGVYSSFFNRPG
jgi:hypothetical protein